RGHSLADNASPAARFMLIDPGRKRCTAGVSERLLGVRHAAAMAQIVLDGGCLLFRGVPWLRAHIACRQVVATFVLAMPVLERILGRVAKLAEGRPHALAKLYIELHGPQAVCVRIHEQPPKESKFSSAPPPGQF